MHRTREAAILVFLWVGALMHAQPDFTYTVTTRPQVCAAGSASLSVAGTEAHDTVSVEWSTGQLNFTTTGPVNAGDYWVRVDIKGIRDSLAFHSDTLLNFTVEKEQCPVHVPRHFSPNGDGYNDALQMTNIEKYPNFELLIYNRWGQQVHRQRNNYTPWQGDLFGVALPDGTYYYVLIYDVADRKNLQKGDITILR